jgi:alpha-glucosidase
VHARGDWWRDAVIYQIYVRSFADGDGDGLGDIAGIRSRLGYLADLGVDAVWINPWYPSPMKDAGYDVSDYRDVEPRFGTLEQAEALVTEAHDLGLRVLLDIVPNHTSDQHEWFQAAVEAGPGSPARDRYVFRDGRGPGGDEPPNGWRSVFGGPAWERVVEPDGRPGQWYLHLFAPEQPDLDWTHPDVAADFEKTLRFWFDRGVDGFRIDVAHSLIKQEGLPDADDQAELEWPRRPVEVDGRLQRAPWRPHPYWDRDEVHEVYRQWRQVADSYDDPRVFVAEAWVDEPERLARYLRSDELRHVISETLDEQGAVGAPATWVLSNHDVVRHLSRFARDRTEPGSHLESFADLPVDLDLGRRRSRAALLLTLALPGGAYVYQGEELGLPEVEDLPVEALQDPVWERSGHTDRGRDGCRVPLPWSGSAPPYGFGPEGGADPWLPQPDDWAALTVEAETGDPASMLELYRSALRLRRDTEALGDGTMAWLDLGEGMLGFTRDPGFACLVNVSADPQPVPEGYTVLLASEPLADGLLARNTSVWLTRG